MNAAPAIARAPHHPACPIRHGATGPCICNHRAPHLRLVEPLDDTESPYTFRDYAAAIGTALLALAVFAGIALTLGMTA